MTLFSPLSLFFLLAIPAIILMYILKQKHEDYTVSSLYLWQEVLKDLEASTPWQKLRKNLLMFLQIAAMLLIVLALARPFITTSAGAAGNVIIVMDTSLSMQATDVKPSRFEAARQEAEKFIKNLQPSTRITLINMGPTCIIEENLSTDRSLVLSRLRQLKAGNGTANTDDAASVVQSLVRQYPDTEVYLFGDSPVDIAGVPVNFESFADDGGNYAITLISHSSATDSLTVLTRITNYSGADARIPLSLYSDGRLFDARNADVPAGETTDVYWSGLPANASIIECRIDTEDSLAADNSAWDAVNHLKESRILLVGENVFVEKMASLTQGVRLFKASAGNTASEGGQTSKDSKGSEGGKESGSNGGSGESNASETNTNKDEYKGYDLYIFDGFLPEKLPSDGSILIFDPPANEFFATGTELTFPQVRKSNHQLFSYINDYTFTISRIREMEVPLWAESVLESDKGPVIFAGELDDRRIVVFGFNLSNTDLALTPAFPILMTNTFDWLLPSRAGNPERLEPGQVAEFKLHPRAEEIKVISPAGKATKLAPPFPAGVFDNTLELGKYTLEQKLPDGSLKHSFTVNAPPSESNLAAPSRTSTEVKGAQGGRGQTGTGINLLPWLLWAVLLILLVEWWFYKNDIQY